MLQIYYKTEDDFRQIGTALGAQFHPPTAENPFTILELFDVILKKFTRAERNVPEDRKAFLDPLDWLPESTVAVFTPNPFLILGRSDSGIITDDHYSIFSFRGHPTQRHFYPSMKFYSAPLPEGDPDDSFDSEGFGEEDVSGKAIETAGSSFKNLPGQDSRAPVGLSLHIGVNTTDRNHYASANLGVSDLNGCENDARAMQALFAKEGYETTLLLSAHATRQSVADSIRSAASRLKAGDIFVLTYSGHGYHLSEMESDTAHLDEEDREDETWVLWDAMILDDELFELYGLFEEGIRVVVISDSCHSGTVTRPLTILDENSGNLENQGVKSRVLNREVGRLTIQNNRSFYNKVQDLLAQRPVPSLKATIKLIAACQDSEEALEAMEKGKDGRETGNIRGLLSQELEKIWNNGSFEGTYVDLLEAVKANVKKKASLVKTASGGPHSQIPNYTKQGPSLQFFDEEKAFTINSKGAEELAFIHAKMDEKPPVDLEEPAVDTEPAQQVEETEDVEKTTVLPYRKPMGRSLHIGLNGVNPKRYAGWDGELCGAESDADLLYRTFTMFPTEDVQKFDGKMLLGKEAVRAAVLDEIRRAADELESGDIFALTFAGFGGQIPDITDTEKTKYSQTWCLYDGQLVDDELYECWTWFKKGVRILVISDCSHQEHISLECHKRMKQGGDSLMQYCHSRSMPKDISSKAYWENEPFYDQLVTSVQMRGGDHIAATIRMMTASQNRQPAFELPSGAGIFTDTLFKVWDYGRFSGDYEDFFAEVKALMPADQVPINFVYGPGKNSFDREAPFAIINTTHLSATSHKSTRSVVISRGPDDAPMLKLTLQQLANEGMSNLLDLYGPDVLIEMRAMDRELKGIIDRTFLDFIGPANNTTQVTFVGMPPQPPMPFPPPGDPTRDGFINAMIRKWEYIDGYDPNKYSIKLFEDEIRGEDPVDRNMHAVRLFKLGLVTTLNNMEAGRQLNYTRHLLQKRRLVSSAVNPLGADILAPATSDPVQIRNEWIFQQRWIWLP